MEKKLKPEHLESYLRGRASHVRGKGRNVRQEQLLAVDLTRRFGVQIKAAQTAQVWCRSGIVV